ncbi:MAG TPA: GNAT family N-acetyltransferase [Candidatus Dormibacteraeota bacterium]|nr:GNAT family N-acetyltransferase [Candidatus Dormibacteraeota bacterium]
MTVDQPHRIELRRLLADDWRVWRGLRLAALEEAPHAFGSSLADWTGTGDSEDRWRSRLTAVPFHLAAYLCGSEAGMVSGADLGDGTAELLSMWVAPFARGCGVGDALVDAVVAWARQTGASRLTLDVFEDNPQALHLYRRHGFTDRGPVPAATGSERIERRMELPLT